MTTGQPPRKTWQRYRTPLLVAGVLAWVVGITYLHFARNRRTTKGAAELLQIGALPVT